MDLTKGPWWVWLLYPNIFNDWWITAHSERPCFPSVIILRDLKVDFKFLHCKCLCQNVARFESQAIILLYASKNNNVNKVDQDTSCSLLFKCKRRCNSGKWNSDTLKWLSFTKTCIWKMKKLFLNELGPKMEMMNCWQQYAGHC